MNDPMEGFYSPTEPLRGEPYYDQVVRGISNVKSEIGIACFTETYEEVLMWTHYASNYAGICLSYSTRVLRYGLSNKVSLLRLNYVDKPPVLDVRDAANADDAAELILSQKKYNWAYEREWRILGPLGRVSFGYTQAVECIFFGSRVDPSHRDKILDKIKDTGIAAYLMSVDDYKHSWQPANAKAEEENQDRRTRLGW